MTLDNLLFTELVFRYDLTKKAIYKDEMVKRLKFCNFDNKLGNIVFIGLVSIIFLPNFKIFISFFVFALSAAKTLLRPAFYLAK